MTRMKTDSLATEGRKEREGSARGSVGDGIAGYLCESVTRCVAQDGRKIEVEAELLQHQSNALIRAWQPVRSNTTANPSTAIVKIENRSEVKLIRSHFGVLRHPARARH